MRKGQNMNLSDIIDELAGIMKGKTIDALIPPLIFVIANMIWGILAAIAISILIALILAIRRLVGKQSLKYALGGVSAIVFASLFAFLTENVNNYFIAGAIRSALLFIVGLSSIVLGKPMAAIASHITRGWPIEWYWRKDVIKAYIEVTFVWAFLFLLRFIVQVMLLIEGDTEMIVLVNFILGWPFNITILTLSYVYGIWRLLNLGGPGVEEYLQGKQAPWRGQRKGF
jgi:hypothetical protein